MQQRPTCRRQALCRYSFSNGRLGRRPLQKKESYISACPTLNVKNPVALSPAKRAQTKKPFIRDNLPMERSGTGPRLIMVCGLPGTGKTTRAKTLESRLRGIRFSPDEWMNALSLDIYDEESRGKIESLQWKLPQHILSL